jgi:hypothetical protein
MIKLSALLTCFVLFAGQELKSQNPEWDWAHSAGENGFDISRSLTCDESGNVYACGEYGNGNIEFGSITLNTSASSSMFLTKYDADGNVIWARTSAGSGSASAHCTTTDALGNIYVAGDFNSLSLEFEDISLVSSGGQECFIVKYDPDGNVIWAVKAGGTGNDRIFSIACDNNGNSHVTGVYNSDELNFGDESITNSNQGGLNAFVAKYDADGNAIWALDIGGQEPDWGRDIAVDGDGNIFVFGDHMSESITIGTLILTNETGADTFLAKLDSNGNALWARKGITTETYAMAVAVDNTGHVAVSGSFSGTSITFEDITLNNDGGSGYSEFFVAKYDGNGNLQWAHAEGCSVQDEARDMAMDEEGNICITGFFNAEPITFGTTTLDNAGGEDIFVVSYSPAGEVTWAISAGSASSDYGYGIATSLDGQVYISGSFTSMDLNFGTSSLDATNASWDFYIAKLNPGTSFIESTNTLALSIYPNPMTEKTTVQFPTPLHNATLFIENSLGERVLEKNNLTGQVFTLDRNSLAAGMYVVKVMENGRIMARGKVVVE